MDVLTWRVNNVVISYGAIRGGPAPGTQEKERCNVQQQGTGGKKSSNSGNNVEKVTRFGEKGSTATGPANGNRGKRFTLAPLPLPSAKTLIPAPLRFLWFSDERKSISESLDGRNTGVDVEEHQRQANNLGVGENFFDGESREKEAIGLDCSESGRDNVNIDLDVLIAGDSGRIIRDASEIDTDGSEMPRFGDDSADTDLGTGSRHWFQNILNANFLKRSPNTDVRIPLSEVVEKNPRSANLAGTQSDLGRRITENVAERSVVDEGELEGMGRDRNYAECGCAGCLSENLEGCSATPASAATEAGPLTALEVPHVNVTHDLESFSKFLSEVPLTELKIISQASFLCNLAYAIPQIKKRAGELVRYHRMLFVTSSMDIKAEALAREKAEAVLAQEKRAAADAAAAAAAARDQAEKSDNSDKQESYLSPAKAYALAAAAVSFLRSRRDEPPVIDEERERSNEVEREEQKTSSDSTCAPASTKQQPNSSAESSLSASSALDNVQPSAADEEAEPDSEMAASEDVPTFMRPVTSVVSAEKETKQEVANNLRSFYTCPCEWFACDEKGGPTRIFSIQGSESFQSWQANLLFEPIHFENVDLGVMVHRGIYEAAKGLYEQVLPQVLEHKEKHGDSARFQFTGHSLGGSLAVLLTFMLTIRGVLKASAFLPVYTFGAPYVLCGGDYLLKKLGFSLSHVQYVVMHRDIVPRSFACNYPDHVAEVLRRVNGSFRDLTCLTQQKLLYAPMGQLIVLQPDSQLASPHPLLPSGSGLYVVRHQSNNEPSETRDADGKLQSRATQVRAAQRAFLNTPHPLEIISDPGAYGSEGSISKNHDPRNYSTAINGVLRQEMKRLRRLQRERRRELWWPLISAESAIATSKGAFLGVQKEQAQKRLDNHDVVGRWSGSSQYFSDVCARRSSFPVSASGDMRGRIGRYKTLIATQHVQMGLLFLLTARMLIVEGFAVIVAWI